MRDLRIVCHPHYHVFSCERLQKDGSPDSHGGVALLLSDDARQAMLCEHVAPPETVCLEFNGSFFGTVRPVCVIVSYVTQAGSKIDKYYAKQVQGSCFFPAADFCLLLAWKRQRGFIGRRSERIHSQFFGVGRNRGSVDRCGFSICG